MKNAYSNDSFHQPAFFKEPPYHPFRPETHGMVDNAMGVIAIPCPVEQPGIQPGPYRKGSIGWSQFNDQYMYTEHFKTAFQTITQALEIPGSGTPHFAGKAGSELLRQTQMAYIRRLENREKKTDKKLLCTDVPGKGIRDELYFDRRFAEFAHGIVSGAYDAEIPGREGNAGRMDALQNEVNDGYDVDARGGNAYGGGGGRRGGGGNRYGDDEAEEEGLDPDDEADIAIRALLDEHMDGEDGRYVMDKVQIIVTHMSRPRLDENGDEVPMYDEDGRDIPDAEPEDAGCIVFFLIMDPIFSMGHSISRLIDMCEEHYNNRLGIQSRNKLFTDNNNNDYGRGGGGGRGGAGNVSKLMKMFPWLMEEDHKSNILHSLSKDRYLELASFIRNDPSMLKEHRSEYLARGLDSAGTVRNRNVLHPLNLFTPEWATGVMKYYGVPDQQCDMSVFMQNLDWDIGLGGDGMAIPKWYFDPERSYHYLMKGWVWNRNGHAGLVKQYFPWVEVPEALLKITAMRTEENALTVYDSSVQDNLVSDDYARQVITNGVGKKVPLPMVPYDPNAINKHNAIFVVARENAKLMDSIKLPRNPLSDLDGYNASCKELKKYRRAALMQMQQILVPTAHINASMKEIMKYMSEHVKVVGVYLPMYTMDPNNPDPDMLELDPFANVIIREGQDLKNSRFIAAPTRHWTLIHYGAQDCHSTSNVDMHVSIIYHGLSQSSKSFTAKDATSKVCVPGTVQSILESSTRSWNVHEDYMGVIIFKDELDNIYVDAKAAERDKTGTAERVKSMMTEHEVTYRVLVFVDQANGRQKRVPEDIQSLFHAVMICCTNKTVGRSDEALSSRFLNFVMTRVDCNLYDYMGIKDRIDEDDKTHNDQLVHAWRIKQCLLAISQALIESLVLPEPSMDAFDIIQARVLDYLDSHGVDTKQVRATQMIKRVARIYVILYALICIYDIPGAIHAGKTFELTQLMDAIPYLYCTKQIAIFAITQTGEIYIHPTRSIVLRGAIQCSGFPYQQGVTIEAYFKNDIIKSLPWRVEKAGTPDAKMNFNYITINGKYKEVVCKKISEHCKPKVGASEVDAELRSGTEYYITVKEVKKVSKMQYENLTEYALQNYTLKREEKESRIPIVVRNFHEDQTYIAVEALSHMTEDILLDAVGMIIHDGFRPQAFLLGTHIERPHPDPEKAADTTMHYNSVYRTMEITPKVVAEMAVAKTFSVSDVSYIPAEVSKIIGGVSRHPDRMMEGECYPENRNVRNKAVLDIEEDIDDWAQKRHHYRAGCRGSHLESPARQTTIFANIREALRINERRHDSKSFPDDSPIYQRSLMMKYPQSLVDAYDRATLEAEAARSFARTRKERESYYQKCVTAYKAMPAHIRDRITPPVVPRLSAVADPMNGGGTEAKPYIYVCPEFEDPEMTTMMQDIIANQGKEEEEIIDIASGDGEIVSVPAGRDANGVQGRRVGTTIYQRNPHDKYNRNIDEKINRAALANILKQKNIRREQQELFKMLLSQSGSGSSLSSDHDDEEGDRGQLVPPPLPQNRRGGQKRRHERQVEGLLDAGHAATSDSSNNNNIDEGDTRWASVDGEDILEVDVRDGDVVIGASHDITTTTTAKQKSARGRKKKKQVESASQAFDRNESTRAQLQSFLDDN